ncbi:hypothetical protein HaLaN_18598 [Haematococcus lacustris]|uniref:Uncharacterized protein n=1 Tax=Haematococcus lacustris TaxID=44745 RepID=A0A699ZYZ6_HAELA|nr:hypothetical protein HaLaN_18598 [Haematococcus lacustris]
MAYSASILQKLKLLAAKQLGVRLAWSNVMPDKPPML